MATLETQYKNYMDENPKSTFTFEEWKEDFGSRISSSMAEILKEIRSPEYKQKQIEKHEQHLKEVSMDYQLGQYVGEHIINRYLPTLSTDLVQSNCVIKVSDQEQSDYEELDGDYIKSLEANNWKSGNSDLFEMLKEFRKLLEKKYIPPILECHLNLIRIDDIKEFKEGLSDSLWNCDMCSYDISIDRIIIENDIVNGFTIIKLKYDPNCTDEMKK